MSHKVCSRSSCKHGGKPQALTNFQRAASQPDGYRYECKDCSKAAQKIKRERNSVRNDARAVSKLEAQSARLASDHEALRPEDWDTSVGNDGRTDNRAAAEKRQEFSKSMGEFAEALREGGQTLENKHGAYIGGLAEQERRFANRRLARSVSISAAHAELARELFKQTAQEYFAGKITPTGYARAPKKRPAKRSTVLLLSDLHFGASMDERGNPLPYRALEEARRFEFVIRQALDYKPQYRTDSELVILLAGDVIEGYLKHDERAGIPLTEQKAVFWHHLGHAIGLAAQQYPSVRVHCQPGNHGRNIARHPGRATEDKWDGIEWDMYYALSLMCRDLPNVTFDIPMAAWGTVELHGAKLLLTHGDTEVKLGDPDVKARENAATFDRINASHLYGHEYAVLAHGHFHKCRIHPTILANGALVPANGHARTSGYIGEPCAQLLWEAVEGYPVGDIRRVFVGPQQDKDERLGTLIKPFRFAA